MQGSQGHGFQKMFDSDLILMNYSVVLKLIQSLKVKSRGTDLNNLSYNFIE